MLSTIYNLTKLLRKYQDVIIEYQKMLTWTNAELENPIKAPNYTLEEKVAALKLKRVELENPLDENKKELYKLKSVFEEQGVPELLVVAECTTDIIHLF